MTAIPPLHAVTRISASRYVKLAPRIATATTAPTAQPAMPADTRLGLWPSPHLGVSTALQARQTMTPTRPRLARPAHRVDTQRKAALATASDVRWVDLQRPVEGQVQPRASHASRVSLLLPHHRHVTSAHLAELMTTPIQPPSALSAGQAHTLVAAKQSVLSVLLVRSTVTTTLRHRAQRAWVVSTGRLRQLMF